MLFWVWGAWGGEGERERKEREKRENVLKKQQKKRKRGGRGRGDDDFGFRGFLPLFLFLFLFVREIGFCVAEKERKREQWKSIQEVAVVEEVGEVVEVDEENEEFSRSLSLSFSFSPTFPLSSTREKRAKKTRRSLFHPFLLVSLQDGVFRAHELAQLLHDRGHDERQGRGAALRATRHDGRTSGRGAASENVGDEKGRFDIIGGDNDHDSEPFELFVVVDELLGWRSCERPL